MNTNIINTIKYVPSRPKLYDVRTNSLKLLVLQLPTTRPIVPRLDVLRPSSSAIVRVEKPNIQDVPVEAEQSINTSSEIITFYYFYYLFIFFFT